MPYKNAFFSVLDHKSADSISPSGVVSITPNEDFKPKGASEVSTHFMNLLNMKIKVYVHSPK